MTSGTLKIESDKLLFLPDVYPTSHVRSYGFQWNKDRACWIGPVNYGSIRGVQKLFSDVTLDSTVVSWLKEYEVPNDVLDSIKNSPAKDFQIQPIVTLMHRKRAMLALAPGLGKSFCSIVAAENISELKRILVVSPLSLVRNWRNEIEKWSGEHAAIWHGSAREKATKWVITNYESVLRDLNFYIANEFDLVIVDESVLVKNRNAKRSQAICSLCKNPKYVWLLSGSPTTKFYDDMWMQLHIIDSSRFSSYWRFAHTYCIVEKNPWGTAIIGNIENADIILKADLSDIFYARTQDQVTDLPPWLFDTVEIPMSVGQYKLYDQMEKEFIATLPSGDEILAPIVLTQMLRLIQIASNPLLIGGNDDSTKWAAAIEMLEFEELPAIIWTSFKATAKYITDRLSRKYRVAALTGDTPDDVRQSIVDKFQKGGLDVIVAHPAVGKFGFTLTAARTAIYLERSYNGDDYYQSLHRVRRLGTTKSPHVIHLLACRPNGSTKRTIDGVIDKVLEYRKTSTMALTSGQIRNLFD